MEPKKYRRGITSADVGFYIALALCVLVLGGSCYLLLTDRSPAADPSAQELEKQTASVQQQTPDPEPQAVVPTIVEPEEILPKEEQQPPEEPPQEAKEPELHVVSPLSGVTVAAFSMEELQYNSTTADWRTHDGLDIAAEAGVPVAAACAGTVKSVTNDDLMGITVVIGHSKGYETVYAGLQEEVRVKEGEYLSGGTIIGTVGNTTLIESGQGAHLHFGVRCNGKAVDPEAFLQMK